MARRRRFPLQTPVMNRESFFDRKAWLPEFSRNAGVYVKGSREQGDARNGSVMSPPRTPRAFLTSRVMPRVRELAEQFIDWYPEFRQQFSAVQRFAHERRAHGSIRGKDENTLVLRKNQPRDLSAVGDVVVDLAEEPRKGVVRRADFDNKVRGSR